MTCPCCDYELTKLTVNNKTFNYCKNCEKTILLNCPICDGKLTVLTLAGRTFNYCGKCGREFPLEDVIDEDVQLLDEDIKIWRESKKYS